MTNVLGRINARHRFLSRLLVICLITAFALIGTYFIFFSKAATTLTADFNNDNTVNVFDLSILASNWGKTGATKATGDTNGDGAVNIFDLSKLAGEWGQTVTPTGQPANSINVKDYGVVGDGVTNNATTMMTAFNTAKSQSKIAYVPNGTYYLGSAVFLVPDGVTVQGESIDSAWLKGGLKAGSGDNISNLKIGIDGQYFAFKSAAQNIVLDKIIFTGGYGIAVTDLGQSGGSVFYLNNASNVTVKNSTFLRGPGPWSNIIGVGATNNYLMQNIIFENNHIMGASRMGAEVIARTGGIFKNVSFYNNIFEASDSLTLDYGGNNGGCGDSIVQGNLIKGGGANPSMPYGHSVAFEASKNLKLINNEIWGAYYRMFQTDLNSLSTDTYTVQGNTFDGSKGPAHNVSDRAYFYFESGAVNFDSNKVIGLSQNPSFAIATTAQMTFTNNQITNTKSGGQLFYFSKNGNIIFNNNIFNSYHGYFAGGLAPNGSATNNIFQVGPSWAETNVFTSVSSNISRNGNTYTNYILP